MSFDTTGRNANLVLIGNVEEPDVITLFGHLYVVPVDVQDGATAPFYLAERDGYFYGCGRCGKKVFVARALWVLPQFPAHRLKARLNLAIGYNE